MIFGSAEKEARASCSLPYRLGALLDSATGSIPFGALVVSLDFELHWGVRHIRTTAGPYGKNIRGARTAIPKILLAFEQFGVAATWATVGFLFARNRRELTDFYPSVRPGYADRRLDPYTETIGAGESDDPFHFARSLIDRIRDTPRQEIGSHTFSHYYCLEDGQAAEAFRNDLESACQIAASVGVRLKSIALPGNQFNPSYAPLVRAAGFISYRGNQPGGMYRARNSKEASAALARIGRLTDAYLNVSGHALTGWDEAASAANGLFDIRASRFLRPYSRRTASFDSLRLRRIAEAMRKAARERRIYHLWWHPHNFGADIEESMAILRRILMTFQSLRDEHGFRSLSMNEAAEVASRLRP